MPSSRQARAMRTAISPRLAIRIRLNMLSRAGRRAGGACEAGPSPPLDSPARSRARRHGGRRHGALHVPHIRYTPTRVRGIGAFTAAASAKPITSRVSSGSTMPSSHRRAVA